MAQLALLEDERPRWILHVNPDDFHAALARRRDPSLRERPVVIGNLMNRGSVVSASYEARAGGVHPGLTMQQAERLVPGAALVQVDWPYAQRAAREIFRVLDGYAPRIERAGLDEAFVDYTGCEGLLGQPQDAGARLRRELRSQLGLDVSIGLAANKLVSRFASSAAKCHGLVDVLPGYEASFLAPNPVWRLPAVGATLGRRLAAMGVPTIGHLARFPTEVLEAVYGSLGRRMADAARGVDRSPVGRPAPRPTLEEATTFEPDAIEQVALAAAIERLCTQLGATLRNRGWCARRLVLRLEHSDHVRVQRGTRLDPPTHLDPRLAAAGRDLLVHLYARRVRVRRLAVEISGFEPSPVQLDLFQPDSEARLRRLLQAADQVRRRYPTAPALVRARALDTGAPPAPRPPRRPDGPRVPVARRAARAPQPRSVRHGL
jgi:DNA polymerase-4